MPDMDGFELARQIKNSPHLAEAVVMMLSSGAQTGDAQRCRELGISVYVTKPVRRAELKAAVLQGSRAGAQSPAGARSARPRHPRPRRRFSTTPRCTFCWPRITS